MVSPVWNAIPQLFTALAPYPSDITLNEAFSETFPTSLPKLVGVPTASILFSISCFFCSLIAFLTNSHLPNWNSSSMAIRTSSILVHHCVPNNYNMSEIYLTFKYWVISHFKKNHCMCLLLSIYKYTTDLKKTDVTAVISSCWGWYIFYFILFSMF